VAQALALVLVLPLAGCDDNNSSLSVTCGATPSTGTVPLTVQFVASGVGGNGTYTYSWSFGDGTAASEPNIALTFAAPGTYSARVEAQSGTQKASCSQTIVAQAVPKPSPRPNTAPKAVFKVNPNPPEGPVPLEVDFNACLSSDPENDRLIFTFDVGDGPYESGHCRREHTYRAPGTYNAKVCVSDGDEALPAQCQSYTVVVS